jgi:predicted nucleic acid-binding Zn ribbon protein
MRTLKEILNKKSFKRKALIDSGAVFFVFKKIIRIEFGNLGAEKFIPDYFANKTLFVKSESAAWASELWSNQEKIVKLINKEIGDVVVEKIKMK